MKEYIKENLFFLFTAILLFSMVSFLVYQQIFTQYYGSDTPEHIIILYRYIFDSTYYISHPLWHINVYFFSLFSSLPIKISAVIISAFYVVFWYMLVYFISKKLLNDFKNSTVVLISISVIMIGPLCVPWYNETIFMGQGSPNVWHNVTLWTVKPFALLSVWFGLNGIEKKNVKSLGLSLLFTIISIFAKPSFIIAYLPALFIYSIAFKHYKDVFFMKFFILLTTLSLLVLSYQFLHTFTKEEGHIIINWLGVWSISSRNISVSIILALAFPMFFTLLNLKILEDKFIFLSWTMTIVSILYYAVFAQAGRFFSHGNFGWSYIISMGLLYLFTIIKFFSIFKNLTIFTKIILSCLLTLQIVIGIYYFYHILQGESPLMMKLIL